MTKATQRTQDNSSTVPVTAVSQHQVDTVDDIAIVLITLISISITLIGDLISCLFNLNNCSSQTPSATNPSTKKKVSSSSKQSETSRTHPKAPSPALVTSTEPSEESSGATGSQPVATTQPRTRKISKDGTTSQATKTSRRGRSTATAPLRVVTKSNQTTPTPGLGFSA